MKGSSVVQLNQRMLFDLVATQPRSFAVAVLAEIGTPGGQGSPRGLASGKLIIGVDCVFLSIIILTSSATLSV